ncbi:MAG: M20/M25/M40 family metallo-hydrolase [Gemmatimonadetes bacterium]|nr:M20/M25/M40 family metallo-hydrolase [Gemmatimonadota bacterium]MCA9762475.1 M20/M25/M40 family metallo-hydrolase [Gemmatimonadota bacterium]MCB9518501.1 M20/M25/M40 family metallo-hydrolase [Gemmatimonadales bacterium]HPF61391.1 M20/M25/M40 family metallo-hydrolase [Gemmatimonadales bacterium]
MTNDPFALLARLLDAPGPSGFERAPARIWREAATFADSVTVDVSGNSHATVFGQGGASDGPGVMFAGHIDEIGVMLVHIDDNGFCWFDVIGGWDSQVFVGQRVTLIGRDGPVPGVIGKQAIHLMDQKDRDKLSKPHDLWIDIGATSRDEALERVAVGTAGVLGSTVTRLPNDRIVSRSLDNRIGAYVVLEALRLLAEERAKVPVTAVATTQEEIAYTGGGARTSASSLNVLAAIVVDVTHATDSPGVEKKRHGDIALGGGPVLSRGAAVNPVVCDLLASVAEAEGIPYRVQASPRFTGTDADAIFTAHRGVATGLVSVPLRYMHSPSEMASLEDIRNAAKLLAAFARRVEATTDFVPR